MTAGTDGRTKIVCTLGPPTRSLEAIRALVEAGMDVTPLACTVEDTVAQVNHTMVSHGRGPGDRVVIVSGQPGEQGTTPSVRAHVLT